MQDHIHYINSRNDFSRAISCHFPILTDQYIRFYSLKLLFKFDSSPAIVTNAFEKEIISSVKVVCSSLDAVTSWYLRQNPGLPYLYPASFVQSFRYFRSLLYTFCRVHYLYLKYEMDIIILKYDGTYRYQGGQYHV